MEAAAAAIRKRNQNAGLGNLRLICQDSIQGQAGMALASVALFVVTQDCEIREAHASGVLVAASRRNGPGKPSIHPHSVPMPHEAKFVLAGPKPALGTSALPRGGRLRLAIPLVKQEPFGSQANRSQVACPCPGSLGQLQRKRPPGMELPGGRALAGMICRLVWRVAIAGQGRPGWLAWWRARNAGGSGVRYQG